MALLALEIITRKAQGAAGLLTQEVWGKRSNNPRAWGPLPTALCLTFGGCTRISLESKGCLRSGFAPCDLLG